MFFWTSMWGTTGFKWCSIRFRAESEQKVDNKMRGRHVSIYPYQCCTWHLRPYQSAFSLSTSGNSRYAGADVGPQQQQAYGFPPSKPLSLPPSSCQSFTAEQQIAAEGYRGVFQHQKGQISQPQRTHPPRQSCPGDRVAGDQVSTVRCHSSPHLLSNNNAISVK